MTDRVYTNLTITSGNLITKNIQCSSGLTSSNINASNVTIGNLTVTGSTTTVNVTEQNVVDTNITTGTLNATGITAGNINFTGSLYQNGVAYQGSQWTTTSGNVSYTGGSIVGTSVSATNMISTSQTTGTLVASSGITAGNINFTGSLYQNGALYSPSSGANPAMDTYTATCNFSGFNTKVPFTSSKTSSYGTTGIVCSNGIFTNTSGNTLVTLIQYKYSNPVQNNWNFQTYIIKNGAYYYNSNTFQGYSSTIIGSLCLVLNNGDNLSFYCGAGTTTSSTVEVQIVVIK